MLTVGELIAHLQTGDPKSPVVVLDHFGRPIPRSIEDFTFREFKKRQLPSGISGPYLLLTQVDIGPDPD